MKKVWVLLWALCLLPLAACQPQGGGGGEPSGTVWEAAPPSGVAAEALLTLGEARELARIDFAAVEEQDGGSTLYFATEAGDRALTVHVEEASREVFDALVSQCADAETAPNLGEAAVWSGEARELMVLDRGKMLSVALADGDREPADALTAARQLAARMLERL